ncbi:MAG: sigma-70 family RNA polymerase sigma factor [Gemmatimonadota bacterium]
MTGQNAGTLIGIPVESSPSDVTRLLADLSGGHTGALERLLPLVYDELKQLAASQLRRERDEHTLGPTALVHEAFFRLVDQRSVSWQGRAHFFGVAAQAMRRILVDHARRRSAAKRGRQHQVTLDSEAAGADEAPADEVLAVDEALERLAAVDPRQAKLVELRYFAGFSIEEAAQLLEISPATAKRDWTFARAWLQRELTSRD